MSEENQHINQEPAQIIQPNVWEEKQGVGMDSSEFVGRILNNDHIPEDVRLRFWSLFSGTQKLTFLSSEDDVMRYMLRFKLMRSAIIRSIPKNEYKTSLALDLLNVEIEFENNLRKALGDKKVNFFELLMSTLHINFAERQVGQGSSENVGFVKRLTNALGGK